MSERNPFVVRFPKSFGGSKKAHRGGSAAGFSGLGVENVRPEPYNHAVPALDPSQNAGHECYYDSPTYHYIQDMWFVAKVQDGTIMIQPHDSLMLDSSGVSIADRFSLKLPYSFFSRVNDEDVEVTLLYHSVNYEECERLVHDLTELYCSRQANKTETSLCRELRELTKAQTKQLILMQWLLPTKSDDQRRHN